MIALKSEPGEERVHDDVRGLHVRGDVCGQPVPGGPPGEDADPEDVRLARREHRPPQGGAPQPAAVPGAQRDTGRFTACLSPNFERKFSFPI